MHLGVRSRPRPLQISPPGVPPGGELASSPPRSPGGGEGHRIRSGCVSVAKLLLQTPGACEQNSPLEENTVWDIGFQSTRPGAGEQFLLKDCRANKGEQGKALCGAIQERIRGRRGPGRAYRASKRAQSSLLVCFVCSLLVFIVACNVLLFVCVLMFCCLFLLQTGRAAARASSRRPRCKAQRASMPLSRGGMPQITSMP